MRLGGGRGTLMVLASAASFGTLPVLVKFAYPIGLIAYKPSATASC